MLSKRILVLMFLLLFLPLVGCFPQPVNQAPIITSTPGDTATVGVEYTYTIKATDPEGSAITYSLVSGPTGMTFNGIATIGWTPTEGQVGIHGVTMKASDGKKDTIQGFMITVSKLPPVNQKPVIISSPNLTATVGVTYIYDVNATDPDSDTLTYFLTANPSGMAINPTNGLIWWVPTTKGTYTVVVKVSDGALSDVQGFNIVVSEPTPTPVNQKPVINSYPRTIAIVGETYTYDVNAFDPDDDILTYSVIDIKPTGMTINSANGFIWWIPTSSQIGDNLITVKVSDGVLSDTQSFIIKVSEPEPEPEPEPKLTEIIVDPEEMDLIVGGFETFEVTAYYDDTTTKNVTFKCHYGTSNSSIAYVAYGIDKVTTLDVGTATIFISYTQHNFLTGEEITKTDTIVVTVTGVPMEIIADDLLTFKVGVVTEFTVEIVANDDVGKTALAYFTLPTKDEATIWYYEVREVAPGVEVGWVNLTDLDAFPNIIYGDQEVPLGDFTFFFKATFDKTGTYPILVEVWEVTPSIEGTTCNCNKG
ncbi:hypothetical protein ES708_27251 [subsurface metagenome]